MSEARFNKRPQKVQITWIDAFYNKGWTSPRQFTRGMKKWRQVKTVGYLVGRAHKGIIVSAGVQMRNGKIRLLQRAEFIPEAMVVSIRRLRKAKK